MNGIVAHELFHVFQGFFLGTLSKLADPLQLSTAQLYGIRWFLEATANYYAAVVNNMSDTQKKHLYADKYGIDYLSVPIDTNDDQNHYSVAYFLDWMSTSYGNTAIVADILNDSNPSSLDPLGSMDRVLKVNGEPKGLSGAYDKYMAYFISHPNGYGGFNLAQKVKMPAPIPPSALSDKRTFVSFSQTLLPLSSAYLTLKPVTPLDALLVIDSSKSAAVPNVAKSYVYDFYGSSDSDYQNKKTVDNGLSFPYASKTPVTIKNFKAMEQLFVNSTALHTNQEYGLSMDYYVLIKPVVKQVQQDAVLWDTTSIGNIPAEYIKGYDIYQSREGGKFYKLNSVKKGQIPYVAGSAEIAFVCTLQDCTDSVKSTDKIIVVIEDKYGNKWPEVTVAESVPTITSLSPTSVAAGAMVTIVGTGFGATKGASKVTFNGVLATITAWSDKLITVVFPAGATPGSVIVEVNGGQSNEVIFTLSGACINDSPTGLCWDTEDSADLNWPNAVTYCSSKGTRLPTIEELLSFATAGEIRQDPGKEGIYLYGSVKNLIPPLKAKGFLFAGAGESSWSSTASDYGGNYVRFVQFGIGTVGSSNKYYGGPVRCVR
jgi:hypothetical protein